MSFLLRAIEPEDHPEILRLSALQFGSDSYQATQNYLDWLYVDNPKGSGRGLIGLDAGKVSAITHEIAAWSRKFDHCIIGHNLFTYPNTKSGNGGAIVLRWTRQPMVVPGAIPPLTKVYDLARYVEVPLRSYVITLKSAKVLWFFAKSKLGAARGLTVRLHDMQRAARKFGVRVSTTFDLDAAYCDMLLSREGLEIDFLQWRYFSPAGPRTIVIENAKGEFCFVHIGKRKGIALARLMDNNMTSEFLSSKVLPALASLGVMGVMANSRIPSEWPIYESAGMKRYNHELRAFVTRLMDPESAVSPAFSDLGLESMLTVLR